MSTNTESRSRPPSRPVSAPTSRSQSAGSSEGPPLLVEHEVEPVYEEIRVVEDAQRERLTAENYLDGDLVAKEKLEKLKFGEVAKILFGASLTAMAGTGQEYDLKNLNLNNMAEALAEAEKNIVQEAAAVRAHEVERDMYRRIQLGAARHTSILVEPPKTFGAHPTMTNQNRHHLVKLHFNFKLKFSGSGSDKTDICEVLEYLKLAQEAVILSETEFKSQMLQYFSGRAFRIVSGWIHEGEEVAKLYEKITDCFYNLESPSEALLKITQIKVKNDFKSLADAATEIERLAKIASLRYMVGTRRDNHFDSVATDALLEIIPREIRVIINGEMNRLRGFDGHEMKFNDVLQLAQTHKADVDSYLLLQKKKKTYNGSFRARAVKENSEEVGGAKPKVFAQTRSQHPYSRKNATVAKPAESSVAPVKRVYDKPRFNNKPAAGRSGFKPRNQFPMKERFGKQKCLLCGNYEHTAAHCTKYPESQRVVVPDACKKCNKGLHHQERFCQSKNLKQGR